jgi:hypothetical protein
LAFAIDQDTKPSKASHLTAMLGRLKLAGGCWANACYCDAFYLLRVLRKGDCGNAHKERESQKAQTQTLTVKMALVSSGSTAAHGIAVAHQCAQKN